MEGSYIVVDRHVIIVEDNEHVVGIVGGIVETFERKTVADRRVADHGDGVSVGFPFGI